MRHSDIKLTMGVYTDPKLLDVAGALNALPVLPLSIDPQAHEQRATGTAGAEATSTRADDLRFAQESACPLALARRGIFLTTAANDRDLRTRTLVPACPNSAQAW
jgi:hypothetical protein